MKRELLTQTLDLQQFKKSIKDQRALVSLDDAVKHSTIRHEPHPWTSDSFFTRRLEEIYQNIGKDTPQNLAVDPHSWTNQIMLQNAVIWLPGSQIYYYVSGEHWIAADYNRDAKSKANKLDIRPNNGDFERNGIYYSFGIIEPSSPPAVILAEAASLTFESDYYTKVS